eukprot:CAMPEP_0198231718 /NCGR_PEP_ID=MMETSP1445-20131203/115348_1 /TAXON_ID=36898 /ORGANISM="Pyramimonas sp., Strain CCMP2087" /LENGTH=615 /DNA_ID=CAMNT_0043912347 /DNA_START=863 /DNA_END=2707 /DNA_ORIENTATION=-
MDDYKTIKHRLGASIRHVVGSGKDLFAPSDQEVISRLQILISNFEEHSTFVQANKKEFVKLFAYVEKLGFHAEKSTVLLSKEWSRMDGNGFYSQKEKQKGGGQESVSSVKHKPLMGLEIQLERLKVALKAEFVGVERQIEVNRGIYKLIADYRKCTSEYEHYSLKIRSLREKKEVPEEKMEANLQKLKLSQNAMDSAASSLEAQLKEVLNNSVGALAGTFGVISAAGADATVLTVAGFVEMASEPPDWMSLALNKTPYIMTSITRASDGAREGGEGGSATIAFYKMRAAAAEARAVSAEQKVEDLRRQLSAPQAASSSISGLMTPSKPMFEDFMGALEEPKSPPSPMLSPSESGGRSLDPFSPPTPLGNKSGSSGQLFPNIFSEMSIGRNNGTVAAPEDFADFSGAGAYQNPFESDTKATTTTSPSFKPFAFPHSSSQAIVDSDPFAVAASSEVHLKSVGTPFRKAVGQSKNHAAAGDPFQEVVGQSPKGVSASDPFQNCMGQSPNGVAHPQSDPFQSPSSVQSESNPFRASYSVQSDPFQASSSVQSDPFRASSSAGIQSMGAAGTQSVGLTLACNDDLSQPRAMPRAQSDSFLASSDPFQVPVLSARPPSSFA